MRQGKLAQGVSYLKAAQTGLWHRGAVGRELERLASPSAPVFDRDAIAAKVKTMESYVRDWQMWFRSEGLLPHVIQYDDLTDNPHQTLAGLLSVLGLDPEMAKDVAPPVARLSDAVNQDWIAHFRIP